jgi:hypothetical protein
MTQRGAHAAPIALNRFGAPAARKVLVEELGNELLIDAAHPHVALTKPLREVGDAADANAERARCVAAIGEVLHVRLPVGRERTPGEPAHAAEPR